MGFFCRYPHFAKCPRCDYPAPQREECGPRWRSVAEDQVKIIDELRKKNKMLTEKISLARAGLSDGWDLKV